MIYTISETLWVDTSDPSFKHDGLLTIRDDAGGQTLVDVAEIPALIEALQKVAKQHEAGESDPFVLDKKLLGEE